MMTSPKEAVTYRYYVVMLLLAVLMAACKKTVNPPNTVPAPVSDARSIRLKQVLTDNLPSPYFFFSYTPDGFVDSISFANGYYEYVVSHKNNRISEMKNRGNERKLVYEYKGNTVSSVLEISPAQKKFRRHQFVYNGNGKLLMINSYLFSNSSADSILEKKFQLTYYSDGNLAKVTESRIELASGKLLQYITTEFSDYDGEINVDDFYLLKDSWGHLIYLPQVKLQKNNPRKAVLKGADYDYEMINTYEYNNHHLPLTKNTRMEQVRGANTGMVIRFKNEFTYY